MSSLNATVAEPGLLDVDEKPTPQKALKIVDVIWIGALTFGLSVVLGFSYSIYLGTQGYDTQEILGHLDLPEGQAFVMVLGLAVLFVGPVVFISLFARWRGLQFADFGICMVDSRYFLYAMVGLIGLLGVSVWLETLLDAATIALLNEANDVLLAPEGAMFIATLVLAVLLVPFGEELFFRVALYDALASRMPPIVAGLLGTSIFTLVHTQYLMLGGMAAFVGLFQVFTLGAVLGWLYVRSRSIWPSVLLHSVNNSIAFSVIAWLV